MSKTRLNFDNLPLIETAVRVSFSSPVNLSYAVIGSLAKLLEPDFPSVLEPKQLEIAPGFGPSPTELGPGILPGAVYAGNAKGLTISVHAQVVVTRWVREVVPQEKPYPRFPSLSGALWRTVEGLHKAVGEDLPPLAVVNISYVNFLPISGPASNVATYLSEQAQLGAMKTANPIHKIEAAWGEGEAVDVRFVLEQVSAKLGDRVTDGYRLTTAAGQRLTGSLDAKTGLELVHDRLQSFFLELISEKAKEEWKLDEVHDA